MGNGIQRDEDLNAAFVEGPGRPGDEERACCMGAAPTEELATARLLLTLHAEGALDD